MSKLTPRDLFNPPPQAGEVVGSNGRHEPTRFVFFNCHRDAVQIEPRAFAPFDPRMDIPRNVHEVLDAQTKRFEREARVDCDCYSNPHHPQCITRRFSYPVPVGETMRSAVSIRDGVRTVIGEIPKKAHPRDKESKSDLNAVLNLRAGGYRLGTDCPGCKGTGWAPVLEPEGAFNRVVPGIKEPCHVVGCVARINLRITDD